MDIENLLLELDSNIRPIKVQSPQIKTEKDELSEIIKLSLPKIRVIGIGGAGNNFVTALYQSNNFWKIVEIIAMNTDAGQLAISKAHKRILIGKNTTKGHGAGNNPVLGLKAFQESKEKIRDLINGTDLLIVCAGLGGGTGSGAAPALIELSRELKTLTMAFVTIPFKCEGRVRINNALLALSKIVPHSTVTIIVPNERLIKLASRKTLQNAFNMANNLLIQLVRSLSDLIEKPGLINVDFSDVRKILSYHGLALPGVATSNGSDEKRAISVVEKIINNPLLEVNPALGKGVLIEIVAGEDLLLTEAYDIVNKFTTVVGEDKEAIFGLRIDPNFKNKIKVTSLITGIEIIGDGTYDNYIQLSNGSLSSSTLFEELTNIPTLK